MLECTQGSTCGGGYPEAAMDLIQRTGRRKGYLGVPKESAYPYKASNFATGGKPVTSGICTAANRVVLPPGTEKQAYGQLTA